MDFFILDCRGTHIKIPIEIAKKVDIFRTIIEGKWKDAQEPYYVNHSANVVQEFVNYLSGHRNINFNMIRQLCSDISYIQYVDAESICFTLRELHSGYNKTQAPVRLCEDDKLYYVEIDLINYLTILSREKACHLFSLDDLEKESSRGNQIKVIEVDEQELYDFTKNKKYYKYTDSKEKIYLHTYLKKSAQFYFDETIWLEYSYCKSLSPNYDYTIGVMIGDELRIITIKKHNV